MNLRTVPTIVTAHTLEDVHLVILQFPMGGAY